MLLIRKADDFMTVRDIRIKIFNEELGLSNSDIFDEDDMGLDQFLIICDGIIIGSFRLRGVGNSHKIERMEFYQNIDLKGMENYPWMKSNYIPRKQTSQKSF